MAVIHWRPVKAIIETQMGHVQPGREMVEFLD